MIVDRTACAGCRYLYGAIDLRHTLGVGVGFKFRFLGCLSVGYALKPLAHLALKRGNFMPDFGGALLIDANMPEAWEAPASVGFAFQALRACERMFQLFSSASFCTPLRSISQAWSYCGQTDGMRSKMP